MLKYKANTNKKKTNLLLGIEVKRPLKVRIQAIDPYKKGAVYMDRWQTIEGRKDFEIRLPQSPKDLMVRIISPDAIRQDSMENMVRVTKFEEIDLPEYSQCVTGKKVKTFIEFAKWFCENAGILECGRYQSTDGKYTVDYLPVIVDRGKQLTTPARISNQTGRMEISRRSFDRMSIPMRMAIICHEFSHYYLNEIQKDEIEADLNALTLYLGMGYPVIEAHKAFLETFYKYPTEANRERYEYLKAYIDNFDKLKYDICSIFK